MAVRKILQVGDNILRQKSLPVEVIDEEIIKLLDDMKDTVKQAQGAGLAAPQIGVLKKVFVVDVEEGYFEFINPVIKSVAGKQIGPEGCLSVKNKQGEVERPNRVVVKFQDRNGDVYKLTAYGFLAKAICHEYDHLDGILYIDKAKNIVEVD